MLTFREHTTRAACAELDVELVEFNGEADQAHLLVAHPQVLAIATLVRWPKFRTAYAVRGEDTGRCVRSPVRAHLWSSPHSAVSCEDPPLSNIKQCNDGRARPL